ncbi:MAG: cytochrome c maturation protein CcmE [Myxococcota bacterium]|nr:cytochrome c maturation protein CcmE [Myxococcota bacterium]MDW8362026.1 cytochrome c maturation protein CcmE [Myxococcales bacterium]
MDETTSRTPSEPEPTPRGLPGWTKGAIVFAALAGVVAFLLFGTDAQSAFVYSKTVTELLSSPQAHAGRRVRVEGELREGSIRFRREPCEWRFVIHEKGRELPVSFPQCVVPDTFRDGRGITVTVQGRLQSDGTFLATEVVPRCPSKYEMEQRRRAGEPIPHAPAPPAPVEST